MLVSGTGQLSDPLVMIQEAECSLLQECFTTGEYLLHTADTD